MEKIGIFGGSFNPIHTGHISLVQAAAHRHGLDRVLLLPCRQPPHKQAHNLAEGHHRLEMCRLAGTGMDWIEPSDIEFDMPAPSYTYDTVVKLREIYPHADLYLIIGADMLLTFDKWHNWQQLGSMVTLLAGARKKGQTPELMEKQRELAAAGVAAEIFTSDVIEISSTEIRRMISHGENASAYLPPLVWQYIRQNRLYMQPEV